VLHVFNKSDAPGATPSSSGLRISALTGEGLADLRRALLERAGWHASPQGDVYIARTRHVQALRRTGEHLASAQALAARADAALDLLAEELRLAHHALGEITGRWSADALLGEIFGRFCIGK
jgi:tRNA modification GTPase